MQTGPISPRPPTFSPALSTKCVVTIRGASRDAEEGRGHIVKVAFNSAAAGESDLALEGVESPNMAPPSQVGRSDTRIETRVQDPLPWLCCGVGRLVVSHRELDTCAITVSKPSQKARATRPALRQRACPSPLSRPQDQAHDVRVRLTQEACGENRYGSCPAACANSSMKLSSAKILGPKPVVRSTDVGIGISSL